MEIKKLGYDFSVCKVADYSQVDLTGEFVFVGKTDEEASLVCRTKDVPANVTAREDGWKAFRIQGVLDFSLIGILSAISGILAENGIGIFAVSGEVLESRSDALARFDEGLYIFDRRIDVACRTVIDKIAFVGRDICDRR